MEYKTAALKIVWSYGIHYHFLQWEQFPLARKKRECFFNCMGCTHTNTSSVHVRTCLQHASVCLFLPASGGSAVFSLSSSCGLITLAKQKHILAHNFVLIKRILLHLGEMASYGVIAIVLSWLRPKCMTPKHKKKKKKFRRSSNSLKRSNVA